MSIDVPAQDLYAVLEDERTALVARLSELGYGTDRASYDTGFADSSQVSAERGEAEALANALADTLVRVEHALSKFTTSTYGLCESCTESIAQARLEAQPAATLCISCASRR